MTTHPSSTGPRRAPRTLAILALALTPITTALADPASDESDILRGPAVRQSTTPPSLVQRGFDGQLLRLDLRPERAALPLLDLTDEQRAAADDILNQRATLVHELAAEHARLLLSVQPTIAARDRRAIARLFRDAAQAFAPLLRPTLRESLAAAIPEPARSEFNRLVNEYTAALAAEPSQAMPAATPAPARPDRARANDQRRIELQLTLAEVGQAYRATLDQAQAMGDAFYDAIDATADQRERIKSLVMARSPINGDPANATPEARAALIADILALLTPDQRRKAAAYFRNLQKSPRAAAPPATPAA